MSERRGLDVTRGRALVVFAMALIWVACGPPDDETAAAPAPTAARRETAAANRPVEMLVAVPRTSYPHDAELFTQGLLWHDGAVYESAGRYGESSLVRWRLDDGGTVVRRDLPADLFAEGLSLVDDRLVQLTWKAGRALVWSQSDMDLVEEWTYAGEGWGLTWDGEYLVMSDGTSALTFRDPAAFRVRRVLQVTLDGRPVKYLNELEWAQGAIWANIWTTDEIVRIDPTSGRVTAVVDASGLIDRESRPPNNVLNGIAYREETGSFLVTGKYWPELFEVDFLPR